MIDALQDEGYNSYTEVLMFVIIKMLRDVLFQQKGFNIVIKNLKILMGFLVVIFFIL